jgi:kumamolisin
MVLPLLYREPQLMRPITIGDNRQGQVGYAARAGWSACTGLGVPLGAEIVAALATTPMV